MIISASYKTDIPAFYAQWFKNRLEAGYCKMVNPYSHEIYEISLKAQDVQGFVFWSRNYQPFFDLEILEGLAEKQIPFVCHMSVTGYPRAIDAATISAKKAIAQLAHIQEKFSRDHVVWRYDPILISEYTSLEWHEANFSELAAALKDVVGEVIVSFAQFYQKSLRNLKEREVLWQDPTDGIKRALLQKFDQIAQQQGIEMTLCAQPHLKIPSVMESRCIDVRRLSKISGRALHVSNKPHRKECGCATSKDIGEYDTCPHGCVYCYAVRKRALAKERFQAHDPQSEFLFQEDTAFSRTSSQGELF